MCIRDSPQTGQFERAALNQFIQTISQDDTNLPENQRAEIQARREIWTFIQNMMKYQRLEEKYSAIVAGIVIPTATEAKSAFDDSKTQASISYVAVSYTHLDVYKRQLLPRSYAESTPVNPLTALE